MFLKTLTELKHSEKRTISTDQARRSQRSGCSPAASPVPVRSFCFARLTFRHKVWISSYLALSPAARIVHVGHIAEVVETCG